MNENVFQSEQAREVIKFVRETYGGELEFLWRRFPKNAIWRNPENRKWYGALLVVERDKLGLTEGSMVEGDLASDELEILDLRFYRNEALDFAEGDPDVFPGYHMNKNSWITLILDGRTEMEKILRLLTQSYEIVESGR